jgi:hypothetical protein
VDDRGPIHPPGSRDVRDVLATDPLFFLVRGAVRLPVVLGLAVALMAIVMIVFGASSESRFIYTDF